ncbi:hypothetical protein HDU98_011342 [Podochytrium sp. JEL0797]|nr:hypothetical protein HDU98_011342 [Podochytrium sp. JEL0797]
MHHVSATPKKLGYSIQIPRRVLSMGETLDVDVTFLATPGDSRLRMMNASLRSLVQYVSSENVAARAKFPRPLAEIAQTFPLVKVGHGVSDPFSHRLHLRIDPGLALASFESPLISVRTIFHLQIYLDDDSEIPNVSFECPVVVVSTPTDQSHSPHPLMTRFRRSDSSFHYSPQSTINSSNEPPSPMSLPQPRIPVPAANPIHPPRNHSLNVMLSQPPAGAGTPATHSPSRDQSCFSALLSELEALEISSAETRIVVEDGQLDFE